MTDALPLSHSYNLARLGNAGDAVTFSADPEQLAAIARWSGVLSVEAFSVAVDIRKLGPVRFGLAFRLTADVTQACVVTLEPVPAHLEQGFSRELHFTGPARHRAERTPPKDSESEVDLDAEEEGPEEIESLHYDLAGPALEEYVLALDPYPRRPGVAFEAQTGGQDRPESPFAVLKGLK
ncbi:MAG TPA: hypothetical protein VFQ69_05795 [Rhizomicrobium sp.]|jgi:uncharacterized metal-binding protein YceD (DUF177 family)|nr:hypothetical protein [Rhizomicrobium sp.]